MFWKIIATGFGSGYAPIAPGTAGSLVGCLMLWLLHYFFGDDFSFAQQTIALCFLIVFFFLLGVLATDRLEPEWGHDPSKVVVDEMIGVWTAMLFVPFSLINLTIALVLFRIFDIWKPLGIRKMEQLKGGWGVMMDDLVAGLYALLVMHLYLTFVIV